MPRSETHAADGFTLVELLVSLAVLAMLSLVLVEGLGGRSMAWTRMDRQTTEGETIEATQTLLADRIQRIWPVTIYYVRPPGPDFEGHAARMSFLAPARKSDGRGPLRRYQLGLDANGDLVLASLNDLALDQDHPSARQVLLHGVQALDLAYFGATVTDRATAWRPDWKEQGFLPSLVRIRLAFADGDRRRWPDLVVHPMADIDTGCTLVVGTGGCKGR